MPAVNVLLVMVGTGDIIRQDLHFICLTIFVNLHGGQDNIFRKILIAF